MLKLKRHTTRKSKFAGREFPQAHFIPYKYHWNDKTLLLKDDSFMQCIKLSGFPFETADDEDVDIRKNIRNLLFKGLGSNAGKVMLYFHVIRRRQNIYEETINTDGVTQKGFAGYVNTKWREKHELSKSFVNEIYVTIVYRQTSGAVGFFAEIMNKIKKKADKELWARAMKESYSELDEITSRIVSTLRDYKPEILGATLTKSGLYSDLLEFLGKLVNCGISLPMQVPNTDVSNYLPTNRLHFGNKAIEVRGVRGGRFAAIVSVKEYGQTTFSSMLDGFLQMPFELVISQSFDFSDRQNAINAMKIQQGRMIAAQDVAVSQVAEIGEALDDAMSGRIGFGKHHMTILCIDSTKKSLESSVAMALTELGNSGIIPVREKVNMEPAYWAQLPGNSDYIVRKSTINTLNLSSFVSMHNYPTGKRKGNHWGDYVSVLDTTSGTPYFFNFHVRDVGHTTIIGPTGAGKTVLMNFLCAQARKFNCRMFFFDKDRGAELFIRALGGHYTIIDPSKNCGFNPFQLDDEGENRTFLSEWLKALVSVNGEIVDSDEMSKLSEAVDGAFKLDRSDRKLSNIVPFLGVGGSGSLANRVSMWHGKGQRATVFDNDADEIDFSKNLVFGFEMGELLKDKASLSPVLLYLFHRISMSLDGTPTMIVLDEAWALIDNDVFAPKIKDWLKVLRKLNCFVIFATQSVEDASQSAISDTLIQQTATQIFLPNLKATDVYRTHFLLSEREFTLIKTTDPASRFFLVKQAMDAVVARVDLSGMDDVISVLSGRAESLTLFDEVMKQVGEDPKDWLPVFWKKVKEL